MVDAGWVRDDFRYFSFSSFSLSHIQISVAIDLTPSLERIRVRYPDLDEAGRWEGDSLAFT